MHSSQRIYTYTCDVHKFFKLFEKNDESFKVQIHENESREEWNARIPQEVVQSCTKRLNYKKMSLV